MKNRLQLAIACTTLLLSLLPAIVTAGEVVTEDIRLWAKEAIAGEKELASLTDPKTLAVLPFQNLSGNNRYTPLEKGLALMLITDLSKLQSIRVVERIKLMALVDELRLGTSGLVSGESAPRIGKLLGAGFLVGGDIRSGKVQELALNSDVLNVVKATLTSNPPMEGAMQELFQLEKQLVFAIIERLQVEISGPERELLKKPFSSSINAAISFFQAVELSDRRQYPEAAAEYRKALALDPELEAARQGLDELEALGLAGGPATGALLRSLRDRTSVTDNLTSQYPTKRSRLPSEVGRGRDGNQEPPTTSGDLTVTW